MEKRPVFHKFGVFEATFVEYRRLFHKFGVFEAIFVEYRRLFHVWGRVLPGHGAHVGDIARAHPTELPRAGGHHRE